MDCICCTLPSDVCIRRRYQTRGYEVWSVKEIPIRTRFGPYRGVFVEKSEGPKNSGFRWKVERENKSLAVLDGKNEKKSSWLRYVNYARCKQEQNLVAVQRQSGIYYVTCRTIPAQTQLLVWYQDTGNGKGYNKSRSENGADRESETGEVCDVDADKRRSESDVKGWKCGARGIRRRVTANKFSATQSLGISATCKKRCRCRLCEKRFVHCESLQLHLRSYVGKRPRGRSGNSKNYKRNAELEKQESLHPGEKYFLRGKKRRDEFKSNQNARTGGTVSESGFRENSKRTPKEFGKLQAPLEIHADESPHQCGVCKKKFKAVNRLKLHERIHAGIKPYKCKE